MTAEDYTPDPRRWKALGVCLVAGFMALLDVSIVNVALPSIRTGLDAAASDLQWMVSGYVLTFGLVLVPSGRLGDQRGRRVMFMLGVAVFTIGSLAAGSAASAGWLVAARLVQGVGGGLLNPQISGLIQELFRGVERGRAFGLFGTTVGVSTAVGPIVGGLLIRSFGAADGWRWIFFVNIPIGLAAIALSWRLLPRPAPGQRHAPGSRDLDPVGVVLLGGGVLAVLLPLVEARQWPGNGKWLLAALGGALLIAFVLWERRYAHRDRAPLVDMSLFSLTSYSAGATLAVAYFSGFTSVLFVLTLYLQQGVGYSALLTGFALTPFALASATGAAVGGRLVSRRGRPLVVVGLLLAVSGFAATGGLVAGLGTDPHTGWWIAVPLLVAGLGSGMVISPNMTLTLAQVPVRRAGTAGGVMQTGQRMGTAAGVAVVGSIFFSSLAASDDHAYAASLGMGAATVLTGVALTVGTADVIAGRRRGRP